MAVSQAPAGIERPLTLCIHGEANSRTDPSAPGTLLVSELSAGDAPQVLAIMATSFQSPPDHSLEQLAIDRLHASLTGSTGHHTSELMKTGFRDANRAIAESAGGAETGVGMLALLTRGKYATLALVGPDRAYLARAGRLNQVTRDQRVVVSRSRRKKDAAAGSDTATTVRLLGEAERLDARSPAIFEVVLLPEDRLALFSQDLVDLAGEDALKLRLQDSQIEGALRLDAFAGTDGAAALMVAVVTAAPAREPLLIPQSAVGTARPLWMIVTPVLLLLAIFAIVAFFLL